MEQPPILAVPLVAVEVFRLTLSNAPLSHRKLERSVFVDNRAAVFQFHVRDGPFQHGMKDPHVALVQDVVDALVGATARCLHVQGDGLTLGTLEAGFKRGFHLYILSLSPHGTGFTIGMGQTLAKLGGLWRIAAHDDFDAAAAGTHDG